MRLHRTTKGWKFYVLFLAGVYNMVWGASVVFYPEYFFQKFGLGLPSYPVIWQGMGMVIGLYGLGYAIAAFNYYRHWPIVFIGFLGKMFGPAGWAWYYAKGEMPFEFLYIHIFNDFIWLIPFGAILWQVYMRRKL